MADPLEALNRLDALARELDAVSRSLAEVEKKLEPAEALHDDFAEEFLVHLHEEALANNQRLPRQEVCDALARRQMPTEIRKEYDHLLALRRRGERRLSALKSSVDAQRSILSALKTELEATT